jgi:hypothetical protein
MTILLVKNYDELIRACFTEDKKFCMENGGTNLLWQNIDNCVAQEEAKVIDGVETFRVETNDGNLVGFAFIRFLPKRKVISYFIRPTMRPLSEEFISTVNGLTNSMLTPV